MYTICFRCKRHLLPRCKNSFNTIFTVNYRYSLAMYTSCTVIIVGLNNVHYGFRHPQNFCPTEIINNVRALGAISDRHGLMTYRLVVMFEYMETFFIWDLFTLYNKTALYAVTQCFFNTGNKNELYKCLNVLYCKIENCVFI